jgi:hypothetical protein
LTAGSGGRSAGLMTLSAAGGARICSGVLAGSGWRRPASPRQRPVLLHLITRRFLCQSPACRAQPVPPVVKPPQHLRHCRHTSSGIGHRRRLPGPLGVSPVQPYGPWLDPLEPEVALVPWIAREYRQYLVLRPSLYDIDHALFVREWPAQDDEARVHQLVHKGRMRGEAGLLSQRRRRIPAGTRTAQLHNEHGHARDCTPVALRRRPGLIKSV